MSVAALRAQIPLVNSALLAALFFLVPTHVAPIYILTVVILVLLLLEGGFAEKLQVLAQSPLPVIFLAYYAVFAVSLLWTQDMAWGERMVGKQTFFLLFPLYLLALRREHIRHYLTAFLASIAMCTVLAWYNWVRLHYLPELPEGVQVDKSVGDTAPFVDRIMYTPILAFAGYLLIHEWLFGPRLPGLRNRWLLGALTLLVLGNALMSGGRTGMIGLLVLIGLAIVQRFARRPVLAASLAAVTITAIVGTGYTVFPLLQERVDRAVAHVTQPGSSRDASISFRVGYALGAANVFAEHPLAGAGAGDLPAEFSRINPDTRIESGRMWNPHNQYLLVLSTTGVLGGALLLGLMAGVLTARTHPADNLQRIQVALVLLFAVICLGESYLARSNTSVMFVLFSAVIVRSAVDAARARAAAAGK